MRKRGGRYVTLDYYVEIELLPGNQFFSPIEIAERRFDRHTQSVEFQKMYNALRKFGDRNGLNINPDNCLRDEHRKPILENGKPKLLPGERSPRWKGKTWQSMLFDEDRRRIREYMRIELVLTLHIALEEMRGRVPTPRFPLVQKKIIDHPSNQKRKYWRWGMIAALAVLGWFAGAKWIGKSFQELHPRDFALMLRQEHPTLTSIPVYNPQSYDIPMVMMFREHWIEKNRHRLYASTHPVLPGRVAVNTRFFSMALGTP